MRLTDRCATVVINPLNVTGDFNDTSLGVNMKNYNRCRITLLMTTSGDAAATVTLKQGTSATADTALAYTGYLKNEDLDGNLASWTKVTASTLTDAGGSAGDWGYQWEVKADELDTDTFGSENTFVRRDVEATDGNVTAAALIYDLYEPRDAKGADGMPSAS